MTNADHNLKNEIYSEEETVARREAAIQRLLKTPPKRQKDNKLGRRKISEGPRGGDPD